MDGGAVAAKEMTSKTPSPVLAMVGIGVDALFLGGGGGLWLMRRRRVPSA